MPIKIELKNTPPTRRKEKMAKKGKKKKGVSDVLTRLFKKGARKNPLAAGKEKKPTGTKKPGKPARTEKPGVPHGVDKKTQEGKQILNVAKGGSVSKFGMLSVKAGVDNNPNPTQADRIVGATKKMRRGGKVTGRSIGPAGASIVSKDGKRIKQLKTIAKSLARPATAGLVGGLKKAAGQLAGRLAKRGYGKARKCKNDGSTSKKSVS
jgi:hypothetical protein